MAKSRPSMEQQKAYQKAFDHLNKELFKGKLKAPMLTLSRNRNLTRGYFSAEQWLDDDGNTTHEIAINANLMSDINAGSVNELFNVLAHEMLHLWQYDHGKPSANGYHNKEWEDKAVEIGLKVVGGGYHVDTKIMKDGALENALAIMPEDAVFPWITGELFVDPKTKEVIIIQTPAQKRQATRKRNASKSGKRTKYTCPKCLTSVWGKADINVGCFDCNEKMNAM